MYHIFTFSFYFTFIDFFFSLTIQYQWNLIFHSQKFIYLEFSFSISFFFLSFSLHFTNLTFPQNFPSNLAFNFLLCFDSILNCISHSRFPFTFSLSPPSTSFFFSLSLFSLHFPFTFYLISLPSFSFHFSSSFFPLNSRFYFIPLCIYLFSHFSFSFGSLIFLLTFHLLLHLFQLLS